MNRTELEAYISEIYHVEKEIPWKDAPGYFVFRHAENRKWFAVIMDIPKAKLGLSGEEILDVVNLKCDPILIGTLCAEKGFFPAYHMNKEHWITVALDGSAPDDKIEMLLEMSFTATGSKKNIKNRDRKRKENIVE